MNSGNMRAQFTRALSLSIGVWDQAVSSLTNFAAVVLVARASSASDFGWFAVGFTTALLLLAIVRTLTCEPLMIQYSTVPIEARRQAGAVATGAALAIGTGLGVLIVFTAALAPNRDLATILLIVGIGLPAILLQDCLRFYFFTLNSPARALIIDGLWGGTQVVAFVVVLHQFPTHPSAFMAAWFATAFISACAGLLIANLRPAPLQTAWWIRDNWRLIRSYMAEQLLISGSGHLAVYAVGFVAGPASLGGLKAAQTLYGPLSVVFTGLRSVLIPHGMRRSAAPSATGLRLMCLKVSALSATLALVWGLSMLLIPSTWGKQLLGETWLLAAPLVVPLMVWKVGSGLGLGAMLELRITIALRNSFLARTSTATMVLLGGVVGAVGWGAYGAAWGLGLGSVLGSQVYWYFVSKSSSSSTGSPRAISSST